MNFTEQRETVRAVVDTMSGVSRRATCPLCPYTLGTSDGRKSLAYKDETGHYKCHRCLSWGYLHERTGEATLRRPVLAPKEEYARSTLPSWMLPTWDPDVLSSVACKPGIDYLESRGIGADLRRQASVHVCVGYPHPNTIVIPHYTASLKGIWGYTSRIWTPGIATPYRYAEGMSREHIFNEYALTRATEDPIIMVEGVVDSLLLWPNACAFLGKPTAAHFARLLLVNRPVVIMLDGDAWKQGRDYARKLRLHARKLRLTSQGIGAVRLPPGEDPNSVLLKGICTARELVECAMASIPQRGILDLVQGI